MTEHEMLRKALACISHPLSIGAMLLLLLNDHLLRHIYPSWWTGKLGDFAWLFFFPFILVALVAFLLPERLRMRPGWVLASAFVFVGGVFILAKTLPAFHSAFEKTLELVFPFPMIITRDATDLVALASFIPAAWLWHKVKVRSQRKFIPGLALILFGMALTMANMAQPDPGIYCLGQVGEEVIACASYGCYSSSSGGLNWKVNEEVELSDCPVITGESTAPVETITIPAQPGVTYSFIPGGVIQRFDPEHPSGVVDYQASRVTQAQKTYYLKTHGGSPVLLNNPQDAIFDPASGNMIFTMGHEGVLVRQANGAYQLVQVGPYGKVQTTQLDVLLTVLSGELGLAACFGGLVVVMLGLYEERSLLKKLVSVIAVLVWLFAVFFVPPALSAGSYAAMLSSISILVAGLLILPLTLDGFFLVGILAPDSLLKLGLLVIEGVLLFFMPYFLWGLNLLPDYRLATLVAVILGGGFILIQYRALMFGTSPLRPEVSSQVEPTRLKRAGWLLLGGAALVVGGIALVVFGINIGFAVLLIGFLLMLGGAWVRRQVWMAAKQAEPEQEQLD